MKDFEAHRCKVRHIPFWAYYVTDQCRGRLSTPLADADSDHSSDNGGEVRRPVYIISATQAFDRTDQIVARADADAMVLRRKGAEKGEIHLILWRLHIGSVLIQIGPSIEDICGVGLHRFHHMCKLEVVESSLEGQLQRFPLNNEQKLKDTGAIAKIALALKSVRNRGCPQQLV
ncbi:hypothetical protein R3P38DRAFT_2809061 [Favolaschia claudopus]|uniref:Uncharacterized protein n=1 Tax=Favolaschia claudopus TaxID=2862362 RepID=A0AAV9ZDY0_9AGAR